VVTGTNSKLGLLGPSEAKYGHVKDACRPLVHEGGHLIAGTTPFLDPHYMATRGAGSLVNGPTDARQWHVRVAEAIVAIGGCAVGEDVDVMHQRRLRLTALLAERVERVRMSGSAALDLAWAAEGRTGRAVMLANKP
jgi:myo-inositol-1(or 4)-monophosphatase